MNPKKIKTIRQSLNMNQGQFAKVIGVSFSTVSRWESGSGKPNDSQIEQLDALNQIKKAREIEDVEKLKMNLLTLGISGTLAIAAIAGIAVKGVTAGSISGFLGNIGKNKDLLNLFKK